MINLVCIRLTNSGLGEDVLETKKPKKVFPNEQFLNVKVHSVVCGAMHTLVLSTMGKVYSWGNNDDKALGRTGAENFPEEVKIEFPVNGISAGDSHSVAYSTELNKVFLWGSYRNSEGKFGPTIESPREMDFRSWQSSVKKVICGNNHTILLDENERVYLWGNPEFGQIGR